MAGLSSGLTRRGGTLDRIWQQVRQRPELAVPCVLLTVVVLVVPPGRADYLPAVVSGGVSALIAVSVVLGYHASEFVSFLQFAIAALAGAVLATVLGRGAPVVAA